MGDRRKRALRVQFDREVKLEFRGAAITSDAGLLPVRELDEAFRLTEKGSSVLSGSLNVNLSSTIALLPILGALAAM